MADKKLTRRRFVATTAAASATMIAAPFVRTAHAAGKLSVSFWDHWVPGANKASEALVNEWAAKEKVEVTIDYITSQGSKNLLTIAAESQAKSGHDILAMPTWWPQDQARNLEPVDDIMAELVKVERRRERHRRVSGQGRRPLAGRACHDRQPDQGAVLAHRSAEAARRHRHPGDVPGRVGAEGRRVDHRHLLKAAEACHKAGVPFGIGLGQTSDSVDTAGAFFQSFGAELVNAKGDLTVKIGRRQAGARLLQARRRPSIRPTRRRGTTPPTTSGSSRAKAR